MERNFAQTKRTAGAGFFGVGVVMPDGTVQEFGGEGRTWPSVEAFHADRAGREANLILHFPAEKSA